MLTENTSKTTLQDVFGYPPDSVEPRTTKLIKKAFPVAKFFPSLPVFQKGLDLFKIRPAWGQYTTMLEENGFRSPNGGGSGIQVAYLADNFPTDSFTNEYGENFLQKFTNIASEGAASIAQIMGATSATEAFNTVQRSLAGGASKTERAAAKALGGVGSLAGGLKTAIEAIPVAGPVAGRSVSLINRLMAGSRIDFPMVWKSSGFQPSYSMTIRLYNPYPQDYHSTNKYIVGPITALLLLAVPRAQDKSTFTWPFLHRIISPGIFDLDPAFISNITVIKGGDQQQISMNQRLSIVDVRIDVGSLYSTMMAGSNKITATRPTVKKYAETMLGAKEITSRVADNNNGTVVAANEVPSTSYYDAEISERRKLGLIRDNVNSRNNTPWSTPGLNINQQFASAIARAKRLIPNNPKAAQKVKDTITTATNRVTDEAKEIYNKLKTESGL